MDIICFLCNIFLSYSVYFSFFFPFTSKLIWSTYACIFPFRKISWTWSFLFRLFSSRKTRKKWKSLAFLSSSLLYFGVWSVLFYHFLFPKDQIGGKIFNRFIQFNLIFIFWSISLIQTMLMLTSACCWLLYVKNIILI